MSPFTSEIYVPGARIRNSPAAVNRRTGTLMLNADTFDALPENTKAFIRHHEAGHLVLDTTNELSADAYAFQKMMAEGRSMKDCVHALTSLLTESEGHRLRALVTLNRAKAHDIINNGNNTIMRNINRAGKVEYLFGKKKGKAPSAKKQARQDARTHKRAAKKEKGNIKLDKKRAKNENIRSRAESRIILAEQGEQMGLGAIAKGVGGILSGNGGGPADIIPETIQQGLAAAAALGPGALKQPEQVLTETGSTEKTGRGGGTDDGTDDRDARPDNDKKKKKDNTALYIGLGIGALVLVVALIFILKK
jgi:hypothetical protein